MLAASPHTSVCVSVCECERERVCMCVGFVLIEGQGKCDVMGPMPTVQVNKHLAG